MRQDLNKKYLENGSFYIFDKKKFLKNKCRLFGKIGFYLIDKINSLSNRRAKGFEINQCNFQDMRNINLKKEFEKILINNKYYLEYNRAKKINYKNYYNKPIDPDGKVRNLIKEEKYRLSQLKSNHKFFKKI